MFKRRKENHQFVSERQYLEHVLPDKRHWHTVSESWTFSYGVNRVIHKLSFKMLSSIRQREFLKPDEDGMLTSQN